MNKVALPVVEEWGSRRLTRVSLVFEPRKHYLFKKGHRLLTQRTVSWVDKGTGCRRSWIATLGHRSGWLLFFQWLFLSSFPSMPRLLEEGNIEEAEVQKQRIEQLQRERRRVLEENNLEHQPRFFRFVQSCGGGLRGPACAFWVLVHCRQIVSAWPSLSSDRTGAFLIASLASFPWLSSTTTKSSSVNPCSRRKGHCQKWS